MAHHYMFECCRIGSSAALLPIIGELRVSDAAAVLLCLSAFARWYIPVAGYVPTQKVLATVCRLTPCLRSKDCNKTNRKNS